MAQNYQIRQKTNVSVLVPASHSPRVRQFVIFIHHAYSPHLTRLFFSYMYAQALHR